MKDSEKDYARDLAEIRSMMERSSKFLSLSGWEGVLAGIYALIGAYLVYMQWGFQPDAAVYDYVAISQSSHSAMVIGTSLIVLIAALITAFFFASRKARKMGEVAWNPTTRRLLTSMAVPLVSGGLLVLVLIYHGLLGLVAPVMLLFYGLSLYNAGKYTVEEVTYMGMVQIALGLVSAFYIEYGILFWSVGFGFVHIVYGIFMHIRYER